MRGAVLYAPWDVRLEERDDPEITEPGDAIIRISSRWPRAAARSEECRAIKSSPAPLTRFLVRPRPGSQAKLISAAAVAGLWLRPGPRLRPAGRA